MMCFNNNRPVGSYYFRNGLVSKKKGRIKHIDVRYHAIRDLVKLGDVKFILIDTESNVADMLTKALLPEKFGKFFDALHLNTLNPMRK